MRRSRWVLLLIVAALLAWSLGAACYQVPPLGGLFRCTDVSVCAPDELCDDGVCCRPEGDPLCLSYVLDGGKCVDGGTPRPYFLDNDNDGHGSGDKKYFCATPALSHVVDNNDDCNDNPAAGGATVFPGNAEMCDGVDNNCNDLIDEGLPGHPWYLDQDGDKYGDPARSIVACAEPIGYVANAGDCRPTDPAVHPGAVEICNHEDDDCNNVVDDLPAQTCAVPGLKGACAVGTNACDAGIPFCAQIHLPTPDVCHDGLDNNCDGTEDERPGCNGPADLLTDPTVIRGAQDTNQPLHGYISSCVKDWTGFSAESFDAGRWTGSGVTSHVAYFESTVGSWDLTNDALRLYVSLNYFTPNGWDPHKQPVIFFCNQSGTQYARYVLADLSTPQGALVGDGGTIALNPLYFGREDVGFPWVRGSGSSLPDSGFLKSISRIEVMIEPVGPGTPTFTLDFKKMQFL